MLFFASFAPLRQKILVSEMLRSTALCPAAMPGNRLQYRPLRSSAVTSGISSKLRVGVVGVGYLGKFHARIYASLPDVELAGVVDADPATAARIATEYQCTAYAKPEDLLGKGDAVSVVVPTTFHPR